MKSNLFKAIQANIRIKNLNEKVERIYLERIREYILFHNKRHPQELGANEMVDFLNHLSRDHKIAAVGVKQALNALLFMYREVLERPFEHLEI